MWWCHRKWSICSRGLKLIGLAKAAAPIGLFRDPSGGEVDLHDLLAGIGVSDVVTATSQ
jgi:hypothetical protein